jgi:hypothetical protein
MSGVVQARNVSLADKTFDAAPAGLLTSSPISTNSIRFVSVVPRERLIILLPHHHYLNRAAI